MIFFYMLSNRLPKIWDAILAGNDFSNGPPALENIILQWVQTRALQRLIFLFSELLRYIDILNYRELFYQATEKIYWTHIKHE